MDILKEDIKIVPPANNKKCEVCLMYTDILYRVPVDCEPSEDHGVQLYYGDTCANCADYLQMVYEERQYKNA